ncbi:redoxin family protein [Candidatus Poribacteria bacterium]|nr:redoxin family protein [Candidatus Poribacteria bacterium]MBT5535093.1 redoxin family protein [Candidatus Poribacteria bacterium]MBT5709420.1 redoxin family protein [Candidatus Poribacteria bacterium]MBT7806149.1 redoxin family protein [Candidatus Poribacteria bacterium]
MDQIAAAIGAFRVATGEDYPVWLSDLATDYLCDDALLLCPADEAGGDSLATRAQDPHRPVSYLYELSPSDFETRRGQVRQFGGIVPIVRCLHHVHVPLSAYDGDALTEGEVALSIGDDLRVYAGIPEWKSDPRSLDRLYSDIRRGVAEHDGASLEGHPFGVMKLLSVDQLAGIREALEAADADGSYATMGAYQKLAGAYYTQMNRRAEAIDRYERAAATLPCSAEVRFALGVLYGQAGEPDRSVEALEEGLRLQPDTVDVSMTLAQHYARAGLHGQLNRVYAILRSHFRRESLAHNYALGNVAYLADDLQVSRESFERLLANLPPATPASSTMPRQALRRLASIYERQGDRRGANVLLAALDPGMGQIGECASEIRGVSASGAPVALADVAGQVTVITFWRSDNVASRAQLAYLESLRKHLAGAFVTFAVNAAPPEFREREGLYATGSIPGPVVFDAPAAVRAYAVGTVPSAVLLDRSGVVRYRHLGHTLEDERDFERRIRELTSEASDD